MDQVEQGYSETAPARGGRTCRSRALSRLTTLLGPKRIQVPIASRLPLHNLPCVTFKLTLVFPLRIRCTSIYWHIFPVA